MTGPAIVVMGVSGCGKSTLGLALAERLGVPFRDGDELHPASNVEKMSRGTPLTDQDRQPWLAAVGAWLASQHDGGVVACSALRRRYRDDLRRACPAAAFVHLECDRDEAARRVASRSGHFMPGILVSSQLALLERLEPDEVGGSLDATRPVEELAQEAAMLVAVDEGELL